MLSSCAVGPRITKKNIQRYDTVRVMVAKGELLNVSVDGKYEVKDLSSGKQTAGGSSLSEQLSSNAAGINFRKKDYPQGVEIVPEKVTKINNNTYKGAMRIIKDTDGKPIAVNLVDMEPYLASVLGSELSGSSPLEALKAQAVVSRTFAYNRKGAHAKKLYDMDNTTNNQVYRGDMKENSTGLEAVKQTKGLILTYGEEIADVPFCANCGGYTENVEDVWGGVKKYLKAVPCYWDRNKSHSEWTIEITKAEIEKALQEHDVKINGVKKINTDENSRTGRVMQVEIVQAVLQAALLAPPETGLVVPSCRMRRGHPWLAARRLWPALLALAPPATLRDFLKAYQSQIHYLPVETETVLQDLDTPAEYDRFRAAANQPPGGSPDDLD